MAAPKIYHKQEQPRSSSASGCLSSSRDALLKTVILSKHKYVRSQPSSQTHIVNPDCSQYLEDYRSYIERKDRDQTIDVETKQSRPKNAAENQSKLQGNSGKYRSASEANMNLHKRLPTSQVSAVRHNSIGGSIIGQSQTPFAKNSARGRTGSLQSISRHRSNQHDVDDDKGKFLSQSSTNLQSFESRSTQQLHNFGIASIELKSDRSDKVPKQKSEETAAQTDPELAVSVQNSCVQTDDVTDDLSYSESDVSIDGNIDDKSDEDDDRNDVRSGADEEDEDCLHGEDENRSEKGRFTFSYEDLDTVRPDKTNKRGCSIPSGKTGNREFDSGIGNTVSPQYHFSFWEGLSRRGLRRPPADKDGSLRKPQKRVRQFQSLPEMGGIQLRDFSQQTDIIDFHSTHTHLKLPIAQKRSQLKVIGSVPLDDWLLMESGHEGRVYMDPWTLLRTKEVAKKEEDGGKMFQDFAAQTFEQITSVVQVSCETQTNTEDSEEWQKRDQFAHLGEDNDLRSDPHHHQHHHTSRPLENRPETDADGREDGEGARSSHTRTYEGHWDDNLTDEIIRVFKDTRNLIAKAKAGKQPEAELPSGKRQLLEIVLREVKNLKERVGRVEGGDGAVGISGKDGRRRRRRKQTTLVDSDSAIESGEAEEGEERRRRTELLLRSPRDSHGRLDPRFRYDPHGPRDSQNHHDHHFRHDHHDRHDPHDRSRTKDGDRRRHIPQNRSIGKGRHGGKHLSKMEPDYSGYKHWIDKPNRIENMPEQQSGFLQNAPFAPALHPPLRISQTLPSQFQKNVTNSHDYKIWSRPVQGSTLAHDPVAPNLYPPQFPHPSVGPASLPVPSAPSLHWRHPTPVTTLRSNNQHHPNASHPSIWGGTGRLELDEAFHPTQAATSTLQQANVVFFPGTPPGSAHPDLQSQGHPSVFLSQQRPVSYVSIQPNLASPTRPSEVLLTQGTPATIRPTQGQGFPVGPTPQVAFNTSQYLPQTSVQRQRTGFPRHWRDIEFDFERSLKQATVEAERLKKMSNRLLRHTAAQTAYV